MTVTAAGRFYRIVGKKSRECIISQSEHTQRKVGVDSERPGNGRKV